MKEISNYEGVYAKFSPGVAGIAAEDALEAAREGDLRRACLLAGVAAMYSEQYSELMDVVAVMALKSMDKETRHDERLISS